MMSHSILDLPKIDFWQILMVFVCKSYLLITRNIFFYLFWGRFEGSGTLIALFCMTLSGFKWNTVLIYFPTTLCTLKLWILFCYAYFQIAHATTRRNMRQISWSTCMTRFVYVLAAVERYVDPHWLWITAIQRFCELKTSFAENDWKYHNLKISWIGLLKYETLIVHFLRDPFNKWNLKLTIFAH